MFRIAILASCFVYVFAASLARSTEPPTIETTTLRPAEEDEEQVTIVTEENIVLADGNYRYR